MAPLELDGNTLADKHRHYNRLVKEAIANKKALNIEYDFNTGSNDIDNMLNIDIANSKRDVDYILKVLKFEDMLYVSHAIKQCKWLITDRQYSHIINPVYLHSELFPQMASKATSKLLLHIRLNLTNENRVEDFYNFFKGKNVKTAIKWLPHCSLGLIEREIEKKEISDHISDHMVKRLSEKSITVLEKYLKHQENNKRYALKATMFLINSHMEKFLDIVETLSPYQHLQPSFGAKYTDKIMKVCPERIKNKFEQYADKIDTKTFAKHIKKEELKDFLKKQSENKELYNWFNYNNVKHFIYYLPKDGKCEFLKSFLIEQKHNKEGDDHVMLRDSEPEYAYCAQLVRMKCSDCLPTTSSANVYRWYNFAPFDVAYPDLIKLIRAESNPTERLAMFGVLLTCAGRNVQHVQTVLQYYHDKHINEPFKFKIQFVYLTLSKTKPYKFDETTWNILNNIFHSMEVYFESTNNVQSCVEAIIVYKLLHDQPIPEIIEKKFTFNTLKSLTKKLNDDEAEKVFNFLYKSLVTKMENIDVKSENGLHEAVSLLEEIESLLIDWKKDIANYPWIGDKIKELIEIKKKKSWNVSLAELYNKNKSWRRQMFRESLAMAPSEETCYNALKHDPGLLSHHTGEVEELRRNDSVSLCKLLRALRVYWPQTLAAEWSATYLSRLDKAGGHKALIRGLCYLVPQSKIVELAKKYAPTDSKINWSEEDEIVLSLRKHLARNMYLSRPLLPPDVVLLYAKGDYLQFALPSVNAVLYNLSPERTRENISQFLDAPVSLQKHGIRVAFQKMDSEKLKVLFFDIWMATKNPSIRAVIFQQTFELLCREKKPIMIEEIWGLMCIFIDNLTNEENKIIYDKLSKVDNVPKSVKGKFFMKSYKYLKALPAKANCEGLVERLENKIIDFIKLLDPEFVANVITTSIDKQFTEGRYTRIDVLAAFLLCAKKEETQIGRFRKVLLPVLERSFALWDVKLDGCYPVSANVVHTLNDLSRYFQRYIFDSEMSFPTRLFTEILTLLERRVSIDNYKTIVYWKLVTTYVKFLEEHKSLIKSVNETSELKHSNSYDSKWNDLYMKAVPQFSAACVNYLKADIDKYFPTIYVMFSDALDTSFSNVNQVVYLECLLSILKNDQSIPTYLMVLMSIPRYFNSEGEEKDKVKEIREAIFSHPSTEVKFHYYRKYGRHDLEDM